MVNVDAEWIFGLWMGCGGPSLQQVKLHSNGERLQGTVADSTRERPSGNSRPVTGLWWPTVADWPSLLLKQKLREIAGSSTNKKDVEWMAALWIGCGRPAKLIGSCHVDLCCPQGWTLLDSVNHSVIFTCCAMAVQCRGKSSGVLHQPHDDVRHPSANFNSTKEYPAFTASHEQSSDLGHCQRLYSLLCFFWDVLEHQ